MKGSNNMNQKLYEEAKSAMQNAYVPYSKFKVGAAILLKDGNVIRGCNVENAAYGLTNCAERTAMFAMYAQGYTKNDVEEMIVIADTKGPISPCGSCRQVMTELIPEEANIYLTNCNGDTKKMTLDELMPYGFKEIEV